MTHKTSVTHQRLIYNCPLYLELRSDWSSYLQSQVKLLESCQLQLIIGRVALSPVRAECPPVYQAQSITLLQVTQSVAMATCSRNLLGVPRDY